MKTMYRLSRQGGISYPSLKTYYEASQLSDLVRLLNHEEKADWIKMAHSTIFPNQQLDIFWNSRHSKQTSVKKLPFIFPILTVWSLLKNLLAPLQSPLSTFLGQAWFLPGDHHNSFPI